MCVRISCVVGLRRGCILAFAALHFEVPLGGERSEELVETRSELRSTVAGLAPRRTMRQPRTSTHACRSATVDNRATAYDNTPYSCEPCEPCEPCEGEGCGMVGIVRNSLHAFRYKTYSAENWTTSSGFARITALVYSFRIAGRSSATRICSAEKIGAESIVHTLLLLSSFAHRIL